MHMRLLFTFGALLVVAMGAAPATAAEPPDLEVENPQPDEMLTPGRMVISGVAFDPEARIGTGVDRVTVFLEDRDKGGLFLGEATLGRPNPFKLEKPQF